jgi:hypothetical protein
MIQDFIIWGIYISFLDIKYLIVAYLDLNL